MSLTYVHLDSALKGRAGLHCKARGVNIILQTSGSSNQHPSGHFAESRVNDAPVASSCTDIYVEIFLKISLFKGHHFFFFLVPE